MKQFDVVVENKTGVIGELCDALSKNAINIKAIASELRGGTGIVKFVTEDDTTTENVLRKSNLEFTTHDITPVKLIDRPGELAKVAKLLSRSRVDIESVFILGRDHQNNETHVALKTNDINRANEVLRSYVM